jgi:hypothetical protein
MDMVGRITTIVVLSSNLDLSDGFEKGGSSPAESGRN